MNKFVELRPVTEVRTRKHSLVAKRGWEIATIASGQKQIYSDLTTSLFTHSSSRPSMAI